MVENEIQFLSWQEFQQMVPSILGLEITRMGGLIRGAGAATDIRNTLVRARMDLGRFITCVQKTEKKHLQQACHQHLLSALLGVSMVSEVEDSQTLSYVRDRLQYVHDRIPFIY